MAQAAAPVQVAAPPPPPPPSNIMMHIPQPHIATPVMSLPPQHQSPMVMVNTSLPMVAVSMAEPLTDGSVAQQVGFGGQDKVSEGGQGGDTGEEKQETETMEIDNSQGMHNKCTEGVQRSFNFFHFVGKSPA